MKTKFNAKWKDWIVSNIDAGCEKYDIFDTLVKNGFAVSAVQDELEMLKGAEKLNLEGAEI